MRHADARQALDNRFLMETIEQLKETSRDNYRGASNEDHLTRLVALRQEAILDTLIDAMEQACKEHLV